MAIHSQNPFDAYADEFYEKGNVLRLDKVLDLGREDLLMLRRGIQVQVGHIEMQLEKHMTGIEVRSESWRIRADNAVQSKLDDIEFIDGLLEQSASGAPA